MGAYENPETAIDTQSGQHWRNLQQTITAAGQNVTNTIIASQKEKEEEKKKVRKEQKAEEDKKVLSNQAMVLSDFNKYNTDVSSLKVTNPTVDFVGLNLVGDDFAKLNQEANDPSVDSFALKKKLVGLDGTIDQVKSFIGYSATAAEQYGKAVIMGMKQQGGIASANPEETLVQANNIFSKTPNYKIDYNNENGNPNMIVKFNENSYLLPNGKVPKDINLSQLSTILKNNGDMIRYVPNVEGVINNSFNSPVFRGLFGVKKDDKGVETWDGTLSKYTKQVPNENKSTVKGANNAVMEVTTYTTVVDRKAMEKDPVFETQIKAISEGILNESIYGATDLYRDVLIPAWNAQHSEKERVEVPSDPNQKVDPLEFQRLFTPFYLNHIQDYPSMENGKLIQTMEVVSGPTSGQVGGGGGRKMDKWDKTVAKNTALFNQYKGKSFPANKPLFSINAQDPGKYIIFKNNEWHLMQVGGKTTSYDDAETLQKVNQKSDSEVQKFPNTPEGSANAFKAIGFN